MPFRFDDEEIKSVGGLLGRFKTAKRQLIQAGRPTPKLWFRGLRDSSRPLIPTFHRYGHRIEDEIYMMNLFKQNAYESINQVPNNEWEWMFLMRHHGLPSRLMDWTESLLIGLFFAVRPRPSETLTTEGVLWCLIPTQLNQWALGWPDNNDSLPMFTENPAEFSHGTNEAILNYLPSVIRERTSSRGHMPPPAAGICTRTNRRMQVQLGVFTIHHADTTPLEDVGDSTHVWRYKIPANRKKQIFDDLKATCITERTLFPDLDNVAKEVRETLGGR